MGGACPPGRVSPLGGPIGSVFTDDEGELPGGRGVGGGSVIGTGMLGERFPGGGGSGWAGTSPDSGAG